ncbi:MAG TPA: type I-U CRISPR-associated protein Csb2 [Hyphomicrobiaceae bacterium]
MFALGIRYLNGWAMAAADGAKKEQAEWPPHPDRIFMALAAAHFETDGSVEERAALEWLETLGPPAIAVSDAEYRTVVTSYVPVNDEKVGRSRPGRATVGALKDAGLAVIPEFRTRQARSFPVAIPHDPVVHLVWNDDLPPELRDSIASLSRKVISIGHSASFVQMWLESSPPTPNLVVSTKLAKFRLRITGIGRLKYLEHRFNREAVKAYADIERRVDRASGKEKKMLQAELKRRFPAGAPISLRPEPGLWQGYGRPEPERRPALPHTVFDPRLVVFALEGRRFDLQATLKITEAFRGTVLSRCPEPIPEWVSGHGADGKPTRAPHLALLPLPFVGHEHADGRLLGMAMAIPRGVDGGEAERVLGSVIGFDDYGLPKALRLFGGEWLECALALEQREAPPMTLQPDGWVGPAKRWASVTPVVFDRHFDGKNRWEQAAEMIKTGCERIGLPRPEDVILNPVSAHIGVPRSGDFPPMKRKLDGGRLHHMHAIITFMEPILGPVIVGAGRFRGYGLCRPLAQGGVADA